MKYYADYDEETTLWCVFDTEGTHAYSSWLDKYSAEKDAKQRNEEKSNRKEKLVVKMKILTRLDEIIVQITLNWDNNERCYSRVSILTSNRSELLNIGLVYETLNEAEQAAQAMDLAIQTLGNPVKIVNLARCADCGESYSENIHSSCKFHGKSV